jgi:hypothetical protein
MNAPQEYRQFMTAHFSGLALQKPVFYQGSYGLRVDLQVGKTNTDEYFRHVIGRATALFEAAFAPDDRVLLLVRDYKYRRRKIRFGNFVHRQIRGLVKGELTYTKTSGFYDPSRVWNQEFIRLPVHRLAHQQILTAIAHADFPPRAPRFSGRGLWQAPELYFLNLDRALIFHMYDDRGLDLIAGDRHTLRPLYEQFNTWLLDYDRPRMDLMFKSDHERLS